MAKEATQKKYTYLEEQLIFYGSYHNHPINIIVHLMCVPSINWSVMMWLAKIGNILPESLFGQTFLTYFKPDISALIGFSYLFYYIYLDPVVAFWFSLVNFPMIATATKYAALPQGIPISITLFVLGWALQIAAHKFVEGRAPALVDNAAQAFSLAPFFLTLEVMFALGFKQELYATMQKQVKLNIEQFHAEAKLKSK